MPLPLRVASEDGVAVWQALERGDAVAGALETGDPVALLLPWAELDGGSVRLVLVVALPDDERGGV